MGGGPERVLVVDDEESIRRLLGHVVEEGGWSCVLAGSAAEARRQLALDDFALVLCDVNMPGESGLELVRSLQAERPDTAVVMVTGLDDPDLADIALELGAYGYVIKPFRRSEILIGVANALRRRRLELENRRYQEGLELTVRERTAELRRSREETIRRLARAIEARDGETGEHIERMSLICELVARRLELPEDRCELIRIASLLHDIGKIGIRDSILLNPEPLTEEQWAVMRGHAELGYGLLAGSGQELLELAATIALTHHERLDGSGYPRGLRGLEIPLEGRIGAVADVFDALISGRIYQRPHSVEEALEVLRAGRGTLFDPAVVDAFLVSVDEVPGLGT